MIKLLIAINCFLFIGSMPEESIYIHAVSTIEGVTKPLSAYQGKKILVMTLPIQQNSSNDSLLYSLDSLRAAYNGNLIIIATPSYEDGYTPAIKDSLKQWYRSILSMEVVVTDGIYTRKTSGTQQHSLFKWLTDKNKNDHFDRDVAGPRDKFIVWTDGELIGVLGAQTRIGGGTVNSLLQGQ